MKHLGVFDEDRRGENLLDTGAHFYDVYRCADGRYVSIGSIEPQFYAELLRLTGLADDPEFAPQMDRDLWPVLKTRLEQVFRTKTRDEWCAVMEGTDVCFAPVLTMSEAARHPHNVARGTFIEIAGVPQPAPAPRFSRTVPRGRRAAGSRRAAHPGGPARLGSGRSQGGCADGLGRGEVMSTLVCFHAHPDDEAITTGGTHGAGQGRGAPRGAGGGHQRRAR